MELQKKLWFMLVIWLLLIFMIGKSTRDGKIERFMKLANHSKFWTFYDGMDADQYKVIRISIFEVLDIIVSHLHVELEENETLKILDIGCSKGKVAADIFNHFILKSINIKVLGITGDKANAKFEVNKEEDGDEENNTINFVETGKSLEYGIHYLGYGEDIDLLNGNFQIFTQIPIEFLQKEFKFTDEEKNELELYEVDAEKIQNKIDIVCDFKPHIILMFGTMSHLSNHNNMIDDIHSLLAENGVAIINFNLGGLGHNHCKSCSTYLEDKVSMICDTGGFADAMLMFKKNSPIHNTIDFNKMKEMFCYTFFFAYCEHFKIDHYLDNLRKLIFPYYLKQFLLNKKMYSAKELLDLLTNDKNTDYEKFEKLTDEEQISGTLRALEENEYNK